MFADLLAQGGLSLDRLQTFCQVAEAGGVTKAAKGDPVRQSLYSRQIKELEEFFGVELIKRHGRGIALTAAGERLQLLAREQLLGLGDFKKDCAGEPVRLTIAAGDSLLQWVLLPRIGEIRNQLPSVTLRLLNLPTAEIATGVTDGTIDVGLIRASGVTPPLETSLLGTLSFSLFVPAQLLPATKRKTVSAKDIAKLPLATLEGAGHFRRELCRLYAIRDIGLNIQLEVSSFPIMARAVETDGFAAILPSVAATQFEKSKVVELKPDYLRSLDRRVVLTWNPRIARIRAALEKALPVFRGLCRLQ